MLVPRQKIESASTKEPSRFVISAALLDGNTLVTTNGHIMATVPLESFELDANDDAEAPGLIPLEAFEAARAYAKKNKKSGHPPSMLCTKTECIVGSNGSTQTFPRPTGQFPNWGMVMDVLNDEGFPIQNGTPTVILNAEELLDLARAICADPKKLIVKLYVKDADTQVVVVPADQERGARGVIMPCFV